MLPRACTNLMTMRCAVCSQVGNNFPVFFIRDGEVFPDLAHALKVPRRCLHHNHCVKNISCLSLQEAIASQMLLLAQASPLNRLNPGWRPADFLSWHPESMHMVTYLFDDVGIPLNYRQMNGSSVNTYTLINKVALGLLSVPCAHVCPAVPTLHQVLDASARMQAGNVTYVKFRWLPSIGEDPVFGFQVGTE